MDIYNNTNFLSLLSQQSETHDANYAVVDVEMWDKKTTLTGRGHQSSLARLSYDYLFIICLWMIKN